MLSWVICSWMVGGAAPPPAFALLFLARAELESSLGFLTAKEAWSWNKRQLSIYNVVCVNQNHCFLIKSQEKQICESGSCFPNIFTFYSLNIQYSAHSAVFLNLNKSSSADCWQNRDETIEAFYLDLDFWQCWHAPGPPSSLWGLGSSPAARQATAHSPPSARRWSGGVWGARCCIAEKRLID